MAEKSPAPADSPQPPDTEPTAGGDVPFPVVGIGASAGGIEACRALLHALPPDTGMAFVVVLHLSRAHHSMLPEILARETKLRAGEVLDGCVMERDHFYVIPAGADLIMDDGRLRTTPRLDPVGHPHTIDTFFRSLAQERGHKAIGVVLSGTSADGTLGLEEIKAAGGITFTQDATAQYDSMPRSAIAGGCVDYVLPPEGIAEELARIARHPYVAPPSQAGDARLDLQPVLDPLHAATGVDFNSYKPNTLQRRVARRMLLHRIDEVAKYAAMLKGNTGELEALYQDVLIGVTSFFRNPECFEALKKTVFPQLMAGRSRHDPIRVWVLGCSTGEEAYSLAITLAEFLEERGYPLPVQVFATDINGAAIEKARAGLYSSTITKDVSPERLRAYFTESDGGFRINKSIRHICLFARHNLIAEPPLSRIDLLTCRNLLIYLGADMQQRVVPILHFALKPKGFLLLGASETVGQYRDRFELEDAKHKIYRKKGLSNPKPVVPVARTYPHAAVGRGREVEGRGLIDPTAAVDVYKEADRLLLAKYAPPSVVVNADFEILQFRGNTGLYLSPAPGKASLNLLKMLREGLLVAVRGALYRAKKEEIPVREEGLRVRSNGGYRELSVEVLPMKMGEGLAANCFMVLFDEGDSSAAHREELVKTVKSRTEGPEAELTRLRQELEATREYLQAVIEQQEAANEELQSANEEVQSANEELQSINEELETSKEELQSSNEELATVNEELHNRNVELGQSNNDLVNLLSSVQLAIVMLGRNHTIRRFTPNAEKLLSLIPADVGRPIRDLNLNITLPDLEKHLEDVIDTVTVKEFEVQDDGGRWYLLRLRPYRTVENRIDGAVVVLVDVDALKRSQETLRRHIEFLNQAYDAILMWELDAGITYWNRAATEMYGYAPEQALGKQPHTLLSTTPTFAAVRDELLRDGRWAGALTHLRADGNRITVESRMAVVRETDQRTIVIETARPVDQEAGG